MSATAAGLLCSQTMTRDSDGGIFRNTANLGNQRENETKREKISPPPPISAARHGRVLRQMSSLGGGSDGKSFSLDAGLERVGAKCEMACRTRDSGDAAVPRPRRGPELADWQRHETG